jgi:hypothetical protein
VVALALTKESQAPIAEPAKYQTWCQYRVPQYGYALFSNSIPGAALGKSVELPLFGTGQTLDLWRYRRIVSSRNWRTPRDEISLINWAQNDYASAPLLDGPIPESDVVAAAKELTASLVYWLQTDAPNADGGRGNPKLQHHQGRKKTTKQLPPKPQRTKLRPNQTPLENRQIQPSKNQQNARH